MQPDGDLESTASYKFSPNSRWVIYVADQESDSVYELFISPAEVQPIYLPLIIHAA